MPYSASLAWIRAQRSTSYLEKTKQGKLAVTQVTRTRIAQSYRRLLKEMTEEPREKYLE